MASALWAKSSKKSVDSLTCSVRMSTELVLEEEVVVPTGSTKVFGNIDAYRFKITNLGSTKYELEIFDGTLPARSYSQASLRQSEDEIKWTFWSSDVLLEASCRLK